MSKRTRFQSRAERDAVARVAVWRTERFVQHLSVELSAREVASELSDHRFSLYRYGEYREALTNRCLPGLASQSDKSMDKSKEENADDTSEEEAEERLIAADAVTLTKHLDKTPEPTFWEQLLTEPKQAYALRSSSFYFFDARTPFRVGLYNVIKSKTFEYVVLLVILFNSAMLALEPQIIEGTSKDTFDSMDNFVTAVYTLEMTMKMLALGFCMHKGAYLRDWWNVLDFVIVLSTYVDLVVQGSGGSTGGASGAITALRTIRVVRPLRSMNAVKGLKILVRSLGGSVAKLVPIIVILFLAIFVFAILSVQVLGGAFTTYCVNVTNGLQLERFIANHTERNLTLAEATSMVTLSGRAEERAVCKNSTITDMPCKQGVTGITYWGAGCDGDGLMCLDCDNQSPVLYNFDNVLTGMLVLFTITTFDGWTNILNRMFASVGIITFLYFMLITVIVGFIIPNLVLAVINLEYARAQERDRSYDLMHSSRVRRLVQQKTSSFMIKVAATEMRQRVRQERQERMIAGVAEPPGAPTSFILHSNHHNNNNDNQHQQRFGNNSERRRGGADQDNEDSDDNVSSLNSFSDRREQRRRELAEVAEQQGKKQPQPQHHQQQAQRLSMHFANAMDDIRYELEHGEEEEVDPTAPIIIRPSHDLPPEMAPAWITFDENLEQQQAGPSIAALRVIPKSSRNLPISLAGANPLLPPSQQHQQMLINSNDPQGAARKRIRRRSLTEVGGGRAAAASESMGNVFDSVGPTSTSTTTTTTTLDDRGRVVFGAQPQQLHGYKSKRELVDRESWEYRWKMLRKKWNNLRDWCHEFTEGYERSVAGKLALVSGRDSDFSEVSSTDSLQQQFNQSSKSEEDDSSSVQNLAAAEAGVAQATSWFSHFIIFCIILNTMTLASQHQDQPSWLDDLQDTSNLIFTIIFTIELCLRVTALGFEKYAKSGFNNLDCLIVFASLLELGLSGASVVSVFRALRLLRVLKLLKQFPTIRALVRVAFSAMADTMYLMLIIVLYLFIFALLGNAIFGQVVEDTAAIRTTFRTFGDAFYTAFQLLSQDLWVPLMYHTMERTHPIAAFFFIIQIFFGSFVLLAMFLSILVETFNRMDHRSITDLDDSDDEYMHGINANMFKQNMLDSQVVRKVYLSNREGTELDDHTSDAVENNNQNALTAGVKMGKLPEQVRRDLERAQEFQAEQEKRMLSDLKRRQSRLGSLRLHAQAVFALGTSGMEPASPRLDNVVLSPHSSPDHSDIAGAAGTDYGSLSGAGDGGAGAGDFDGEEGGAHAVAIPHSASGAASHSESPPEGSTVVNPYLTASALRSLPALTAHQTLYAFLVLPDGGGNYADRNKRPQKCKKGTFGDLSLESVPPEHMLPREFKDARLKRKQSQNAFFAPAPRRIRDIVPAIILFHEGPAPPDTPPKERNVTCDKCGEVYAQPLPAAPLMAPPDPEMFHDLQCSRIRLRKAKQSMLNSLLNIVSFYIANDEERTPEKVESLLSCAWKVKCMTCVTTEDILETDSPWHTLETEIKEQLDVLELRTGEEELGKSLVAYAFACIPIEHQTNGGWSLFVFGPENKFRREFSKLVWDPIFGHFILFCIIASSVLIAMQNPRNDKDSEREGIITNVSLFFTIIFTVEALIKIIALGFVFQEGAYLRQMWNWLDFLVVIVSLITDTEVALSFRFLRIIRTLRALRPLRILNRNSNLKTTAYAMAENLKAIANVAVLMVIALFIFSILAVQLFAGKFHSCSDPSRVWKDECWGTWWDPNAANRNTSLLDGRPFGAFVNRTWGVETRNFDNIGTSLLTLFQISTSEAWLQILWRSFSACSNDKSPDLDCNKFQGLFFVAFFAMAGFFLTQLFVSFIIHNYDMVQASINGSKSMTEEQKMWVQTQQLLVNLRPYIAMVPESDDVLSQWLYTHIVKKPWFDPALVISIFTDILTIALIHYDMSDAWSDASRAFNIIFQIIFTLEAAIKIGAFRVRYFRSGANQFDFFLVIIGFVGLAAEDVSALRVLRVFRFFRILRLLRGAQGVQILIETVIYSLPSISNMGAFIVLITFSFGVLGVDLMAKLYIPPNANVLDNRYNNFRQLDNALMLLYRFLTLEDWVGALSDAQLTEPTCTTEENCGSSAYPLYFCGFVVINTYIILNLVMAIILVNFELTMKLTGANVRLGQFHKFVDIWSEYDDATLKLPTNMLPLLLYRLGPPLGLSRKDSRNQIMRKLRNYFIPEHGGLIHFIEVLLALAQGSKKTDLSVRDQREFSERLRSTFDELDEMPVLRHNNRTLTADLYFAQTFMAAAYRRNRVVAKVVDRLRGERREILRQYCEENRLTVPEPRITMRIPLIIGARVPRALSTSDGNAINIPIESYLGRRLLAVAYKKPRELRAEQLAATGSDSLSGYMSNIIQSATSTAPNAIASSALSILHSEYAAASAMAASSRSPNKDGANSNVNDDDNDDPNTFFYSVQQEQLLQHKDLPAPIEEETSVAALFAANFLERQRRQNLKNKRLGAAAAAAAAAGSGGGQAGRNQDQHHNPEIRVDTPSRFLIAAGAADAAATPSTTAADDKSSDSGTARKLRGKKARSTNSVSASPGAAATAAASSPGGQEAASPQLQLPPPRELPPLVDNNNNNNNTSSTLRAKKTTFQQQEQLQQPPASSPPPAATAAPPAMRKDTNTAFDYHATSNINNASSSSALSSSSPASGSATHTGRKEMSVRFMSPAESPKTASNVSFPTSSTGAAPAASSSSPSPQSSQNQQQHRPQSARTAPQQQQQPQPQPQQTHTEQTQQQQHSRPRSAAAGAAAASSTPLRYPQQQQQPQQQPQRSPTTPNASVFPAATDARVALAHHEGGDGDDDEGEQEEDEPSSKQRALPTTSPPPSRPPVQAQQPAQGVVQANDEDWDEAEEEEEEEEQEEEAQQETAVAVTAKQQQQQQQHQQHKEREEAVKQDPQEQLRDFSLDPADYNPRHRFRNVFELDDRESLLRANAVSVQRTRWPKILKQAKSDLAAQRLRAAISELEARHLRIADDDIQLQRNMELANMSSDFRKKLRAVNINQALFATQNVALAAFRTGLADFVAEHDAIVRRHLFEKRSVEQRLERAAVMVQCETALPGAIYEPEQLARVRVLSSMQRAISIIRKKEEVQAAGLVTTRAAVELDEESARTAMGVLFRQEEARGRRDVLQRELCQIEKQARAALEDTEKTGERATLADQQRAEFEPLFAALFVAAFARLEREAVAALNLQINKEDDADRALIATQFNKHAVHTLASQHRRERGELEAEEQKQRAPIEDADETTDRENVHSRRAAALQVMKQRLHAERLAQAIAQAKAAFERELFVLEEKACNPSALRAPIVAEEAKARGAIALARRAGAANILSKEHEAARRVLEGTEAETRAVFVTAQADAADEKLQGASTALARMAREQRRHQEQLIEEQQTQCSRIQQQEGEAHISLSTRSQQLYETVLSNFFEAVRRRAEISMGALLKREAAERSNVVAREEHERDERWECPACRVNPPYRLSRLAADINESPNGMGSKKLRQHLHHHQIEIQKMRIQRQALITEQYCSRGVIEASAFSQYMLEVYGALSTLHLAVARQRCDDIASSTTVAGSLAHIRKRERAEWLARLEVCLFAEQRARLELQHMAVRGTIEIRAMNALLVYQTTDVDSTERAPLLANMRDAFPLQTLFMARKRQQKPLLEDGRNYVDEKLPRRRVTMSIIARNAQSDDEECFEPVADHVVSSSGPLPPRLVSSSLEDDDAAAALALGRVEMLERTVDALLAAKEGRAPSPLRNNTHSSSSLSSPTTTTGAGGGGGGGGGSGATGSIGASPFVRHHSFAAANAHNNSNQNKQLQMARSAAHSRGAQLLDSLHADSPHDDDDNADHYNAAERELQLSLEKEASKFAQEEQQQQQQQQQSSVSRNQQQQQQHALLSRQTRSRLAIVEQTELQYRDKIATTESDRRARMAASRAMGVAIVGLSPQLEEAIARLRFIEAARRQGLCDAEISDRAALYGSRRGSRLKRPPRIGGDYAAETRTTHVSPSGVRIVSVDRSPHGQQRQRSEPEERLSRIAATTAQSSDDEDFKQFKVQRRMQRYNNNAVAAARGDESAAAAGTSVVATDSAGGFDELHRLASASFADGSAAASAAGPAFASIPVLAIRAREAARAVASAVKSKQFSGVALDREMYSVLKNEQQLVEMQVHVAQWKTGLEEKRRQLETALNHHPHQPGSRF